MTPGALGFPAIIFCKPASATGFIIIDLHWTCSCLREVSKMDILSLGGLSGLLQSELITPSTLLGLAELAIENTPESA